MKIRLAKKIVMGVTLGVTLLWTANQTSLVQAAENQTIQEDTAQTSEYNGFSYELRENGTAFINGYFGTDSVVNVPAEIEGCKVTGITECFNYTDGIKEITLPDTLSFIGFVGTNCRDLEKLTINTYNPKAESEGAAFIYQSGIFNDCDKLNTIIVNENSNFKTFWSEDNVLYCGDLEDMTLALYPAGKKDENYEFKYSMKIGNSAFDGNEYIKNVVFKEAIKEGNIPSTHIFYHCRNLESVVLEKGGLTQLVDWFDGCRSLKSFKIPDTVKKIGSMTFNGCTSLEKIEIPESVTYVMNSAFQDCWSLEACIVHSDNIVFESSTVEGEPFESIWNGCNMLTLYCNENSNTEAYAKKFEIPYDQIENYEDKVHMHELVKIDEVKPSCTEDGQIEFWLCPVCNKVFKDESTLEETNVEDLKIEAAGHTWDKGAVTTNPTATTAGLRTYTCTECKSIKTETIAATGAPEAGTILKDTVTGLSYKITKAGISNGEVELVKSVFENKKLSIPPNVTFEGISYKVTSVADKAFKGNKKVKTVIICQNVRKIGKEAFRNCTSLKNITIKSTVLEKKSVGKKAYENIHKKAKVKVPSQKKAEYKKMLKKSGITKKNQKIV